MIETIRTTTGREGVVIDAIVTRIKNKKLPIKSVFFTEDLRGYVFLEGEADDIEAAIKGIPHIRGVVARDVKFAELEKFLVPEKREIKLDVGDIVEVIGGPFKGERAKITRVDETKGEITVEMLEAPIPIPVTIPSTSVRMYEKKKAE
ncbi:MAG: transcription elongation factor Spt5 [Candidatus Aenigmatarchaeota archaeon]